MPIEHKFIQPSIAETELFLYSQLEKVLPMSVVGLRIHTTKTTWLKTQYFLAKMQKTMIGKKIKISSSDEDINGLDAEVINFGAVGYVIVKLDRGQPVSGVIEVSLEEAGLLDDVNE